VHATGIKLAAEIQDG